MLKNEIIKLINLKAEGGYWDFKQEWHSNKSDLLHDIICMANNLEDCDAYIIIGVDDDCRICGVPETNRKNQQNLIDFLKNIDFAGDVRPIVYVQSLAIYDNTVDVIIIKNTANTPYYLSKECRGVHAGNIYTRVIDTNTPKDSNADIDKIEWLWKKRFGLVGNSAQRIKSILLSTGWVWENVGDDSGHFFNLCYPEIRIDINKRETNALKTLCSSHDSFFYLYANPLFWTWISPENLTRKCYNILWHGNRILKFYTINAPRMDFDFVEPKSAFLDNSIGILLDNAPNIGAQYCYFIKDDVEYMLFQIITKLRANRTSEKYYEMQGISCPSVIPIFTNETEYTEFMKHVNAERVKFKSEYDEINIENDIYSSGQVKSSSRIEQSFKVGKLLVKWLEDWRVSL